MFVDGSSGFVTKFWNSSVLPWLLFADTALFKIFPSVFRIVQWTSGDGLRSYASEREGSKKRARASTDGDRPQKAARLGIPGETSRQEDIPVPRRQSGGDEKVGVDRIVRAADVKDGVVLSLLWENPDAMAYVRLGSKFLDSRRFGALLSYGRVMRIIYGVGLMPRCTEPGVCVRKRGVR